MKNILNLKKLGLVMITTVFSVILIFSITLKNTSFAEDTNNYDQDISAFDCITEGNSKFTSFVDFFIYSGTFSDAYLEPFYDIIRNQCQVSDIHIIKMQKQRIFENARRLMLQCEYEKAEKLKIAITEANAELYYVRNIVDTTKTSIIPTVMLTDTFLKSVQKDETVLGDEIKKIYFDDNLPIGYNADLFIQRLQQKYSTRKNTYIHCENSALNSVKEKWAEFTADWGGVKDAGGKMANTVGQAVDSTVNAYEKSEKEIKNGWDMMMKSSGTKILESAAKSIAVANLNDLMFKDGVDEAFSDFSKLKIENASTYSQLLNTLNNVSDRINVNDTQVRLSTEFQSKYSASDASVGYITDKLEAINKTLNDTIKEVSRVKDCIEKVNYKQCSN